MKRIFVLLFAVMLLFSGIPFAHAAETVRTEFTTQDGITVIDELVVESNSRATDKAGTRTRTYKDGDTTIAVVAIRVVFRYDGTTSRVISQSVTRSDTYDGWSYSQTSFTASGATATLQFKLKKLIYSYPYSISLTCDKDGNLS